MILLHGSGTRNKGAELMGIAVLEHFRARSSPSIIAVPASFGSFDERSRYRVYTLLPQCKWYRRTAFALYLLSDRFLRSNGLVRISEITTVIDVSGYLFGDPFSPETISEAKSVYEAAKNCGARIILMPQSFGPFTRRDIRKLCFTTLSLCDCIIAREPSSLAHLTNLGLPQTTIRGFPDFTCLVAPERPPEDLSTLCSDAVVIVPNRQIRVKLGEREYLQYLDCLCETIRAIQARRLPVVFLLHCSSDIDVCSEVEARIGCHIPTVYLDNPKELKALLGMARLVIGSRYHALVSALSQGVPAIALGWSDKYVALLSDYDCSEYVASCSDKERVLIILESLISCGEQYFHTKSSIIAAAERVRREVEKMWEYVDSLVIL